MSDNEDLLGDDLGDHSLADYNLGNEEEDQLLADDYESGASQNVPSSIPNYREPVEMLPAEYPVHELQYNNQPHQYQMPPLEPECVVPNITVEVPNAPIPEQSTYAPYEPPPVFEQELAIVPPAIPAAPMESPQIVPSEMVAAVPNGDMGGPRERFISERPPGAQRMPQVRDIPDSLDKVVVPRGFAPGRGRSSWRNPQFAARYSPHHYRRHHPHMQHHMNRGNFNQRASFPPPQMRHPPQMRPDIRPNPHPHIRPDIRPEIRPEMLPPPPQMGPEISPEQPILPTIPMEPPFRPMDIRPFPPRFPPQFRPALDEPRPNFGPNIRPPFDQRPMFPYRPEFRPYAPPIREVAPNSMTQLPQVTIRHAIPGLPHNTPKGREPEVRMLPVQLPPNLPPGGLAGKKVLINPHFKGNFQPVDGLSLPAYIPTRIQKTPPLSPTLESKFGPIKDIDDAAERFIAEQRNALARAAGRKVPRRSPQRYIENTTIEIENELAGGLRRSDADLLRRQEEFITANREGLRRRMRSPSPPRRSSSPRRSPERLRPRVDGPRPQPTDEDSEYRRRMREQESLRERVLRAKEARRRKNAQGHERERERQEKLDKEKEAPKPAPKPESKPEVKPESRPEASPCVEQLPDTTRRSPEAVRGDDIEGEAEVNSTCENLTPPRCPSPARALTPPLPKARDSDDELDLILDDIDGILSDEDDSGRFKAKDKPEPPKSKPTDLRSKLPPKAADTKRPPRQKIVFGEDRPQASRDERRRKDKSPPRRTLVSSSTKTEDSENVDKKALKAKEKSESAKEKSRQRIIFDNKEKELEKEKDDAKTQFANRRVILQRKVSKESKSVFTRVEVKTDPTKPNPGIFSRAVRTAIGSDKSRIVIKKQDEPQIEYESGSDVDEEKLLEDVGNIALVSNLPHGMTDTRMKTLAGSDVQTLLLDKEDRSAKITFKTTVAAETFKRKFNNKMVAASRLTVTLR